MQQNPNTIKNIARLVVVFVVVALAYATGTWISHSGKNKVTLVVIPSDSAVTVNGKAESSRTLYLKPGTYTFVANRLPFDTATTKETINSSTKLYLMPKPTSKAAIDYLNNNPDVQAQREAAGGAESQAISSQITQQLPLISRLPYSDITGPFTVGYGQDGNQLYLIVYNSSPNGRANALRWIRDQGYDPANLVIKFKDFINPITIGSN